MSPIDITRAAASSVALALSLVPDDRVAGFARPVAEIPAMVDRVIRRRGRIQGQARAVGAWVDILDDAIPGVDAVIPEEVRDALITVGVWAAAAIGGLVEARADAAPPVKPPAKFDHLTLQPHAVKADP